MSCLPTGALGAGALAAPLVHIRQEYRACWQDLSLAVESGFGQWTARVQQSGHSLYTVQRSNAAAAQMAAMEFALFRTRGSGLGENPEQLAREIEWIQYW